MFKKTKKPSLFLSFLPILFTSIILGLSVLIYNTQPHIPLLAGASIAGLSAYLLGYSWEEIEEAVIKNISRAIPALIILLIIGMLIGVWIGSGIVPALIFYGFNLIIPSWFLPSIFILCIVVSLLTGSSWTTVGTIGVAAIAIGQGLNISPAIIAGAVVSGAFFGDKISPLSDSTNLTPSVLGVGLYEHIRHMLYTTIPSAILAVIIYGVIGRVLANSRELGSEALEIQRIIQDNFEFSFILFIPPLVVLIMIIKKSPPIPSLLAGVFLGSLVQIFIQGQGVGATLRTIYSGFEISTASDEISPLLSRGGIDSMYSVVVLGIIALAFGGIMYECGMLTTIVGRMKSMVSSQGNLIAITLATAIGINIVGANQYLAVILPGQMYKDSYGELNLELKNLSRALEGGGTLTAPLIPWNTSGVFVMSILGVSPSEYWPYAIFCWLTAIVVAIYGYTNITITKKENTA